MALHPDFPKSPFVIPEPDQRWFPADEALRESAYEKLLPPLVAKVRKKVARWREDGSPGISNSSKALLDWWFARNHQVEEADGSLTPFRYYFAQQEAVESVICLYEAKAREELDLPFKMARLKQWCENATESSQAEGGPAYGFVYVDQDGFKRNPLKP